MKLICIEDNYPLSNNTSLAPLISQGTTRFPAVYTKADSSIILNGRPFFLPDFTKHCTYAAMLVVRINRLGRSISERFAHRYYDAITIGIDFTAQDLYELYLTNGEPCDLSKSFDGAAPLGRFIPLDGHSMNDITFRLDIDGHTMQCANTREMLHSVDALIAYVSQFYTLKQGDLLFTGTPAGKGIASIGQHYEGYIEGDRVLNFHIR